jgi:hypothetical protein
LDFVWITAALPDASHLKVLLHDPPSHRTDRSPNDLLNLILRPYYARAREGRRNEFQSGNFYFSASANRIRAPEIICDAYTLQSSSTTVARGELESARQVFAILIEGIWFAQDSPLEGDGFELSVPGCGEARRDPIAGRFIEDLRTLFEGRSGRT